MRALRVAALVVLLVAAAAGSWWLFGRRTPGPVTITVYYTKPEGAALVPWQVSLGPARDPRSVAFYAAVQTVAGPPAGVEAVRFPRGTQVLSADLDGTTVDVDLSREVGTGVEGSFNESGVRVLVGGERLATLPGGHLELDEPLSRQSF
jgi:hypothetical protein